jgi:tetratricopeptide (TPR) repeat protein
LTILCVLAGPASGLSADGARDARASLDRVIAAAEARLQAGDAAGAGSHYRAALFQGWLLLAGLETSEGRSDAALTALRNAEAFADADLGARRLLAKELGALGQVDDAVRLLEAAAEATTDPEPVFVLASDCLWLKRIDAADRLFARLLQQRPIAETRVLIGHAYRDAGEYTRARQTLEAALEQDPGARRARYFLATAILADPGSGPERLDLAIRELEAAVKIAPEDPLAWDQLGVSLLEAGRQAEALRAAEKAVALEARALYVYHLARCQMALDQAASAVASSRRALDLATEQGAGEPELERIRYQLGLALRKTGSEAEAATHLAEARRLAARWTAAPASGSPLAGLSEAERAELKRSTSRAMAGAYLNLGVLEAQGQQFDRAVELLQAAAELDPESSPVQYALGIACFSAKRYDQAIEPLRRALAANPADAGLRRTLALASLNAGAYARAAELLAQDPDRERDPSLRFAYGLALAHSGRKGEAEAIFRKLLADQGESAELRDALRQLEAAP